MNITFIRQSSIVASLALLLTAGIARAEEKRDLDKLSATELLKELDDSSNWQGICKMELAPERIAAEVAKRRKDFHVDELIQSTRDWVKRIPAEVIDRARAIAKRIHEMEFKEVAPPRGTPEFEKLQAEYDSLDIEFSEINKKYGLNTGYSYPSDATTARHLEHAFTYNIETGKLSLWSRVDEWNPQQDGTAEGERDTISTIVALRGDETETGFADPTLEDINLFGKQTHSPLVPGTNFHYSYFQSLMEHLTEESVAQMCWTDEFKISRGLSPRPAPAASEPTGQPVVVADEKPATPATESSTPAPAAGSEGAEAGK